MVAGKEISIYDKRSLKLSKEEVQRRLDAGEPHVIRFNMPTEGTTTFHDVIYGDITVNNEELEDLILIKSDGYPTYYFANVVDDHLWESHMWYEAMNIFPLPLNTAGDLLM